MENNFWTCKNLKEKIIFFWGAKLRNYTMDALPDEWNTQDKFLIFLEAASMNETELAEHACKKELSVEQIRAWKVACMNANGEIAEESTRLNKELKNSEKELQCKEKTVNAYR